MAQAVRLEGRAPGAEVTPLAERRVVGGYFWGTLRLALGWIFLWSFLDKLLALGFSTGRADSGAIDFLGKDAWINGGSPTFGYLEFGTRGPFREFFAGLSTAVWVEWVFMLSLLLIGLGLVLGVGVRIAALGGVAWMVLFYLSGAIWPEHNPFLDDHLIYAIALLGVAYVGAGRWLGLGGWWARTGLVRRYPILE